MTDRELCLRRARRTADALVRRWGLDRPEPIPVEDLALACGLQVVDGPLRTALARLFRVGTRGTIRLSDRHDHPGQRRFSLAHELGHFLLRHDRVVDLCHARDLHGLGKLREAEANAFAAELLLPERVLRRRCEVSPVSLDYITELAADFGTSPAATAIRFVELTSERCAVVLSQRSAIRWAVVSETFWPRLVRGQRLLPWSLAHSYFATGRLAASADMLAAWIDGSALRGPAEIHEHALVIPQLRAVLSLLWISEACSSLVHRA